MKNRKSTFLTSLCLYVLMVLSFLRVSAQSPRLYTIEHGLPSTRFSEIMFDSDNFMWVATSLGMARFDGMNFHIYRSDKENDMALHDDNINCVYEDSYHNHWIGTSDGLYYFCRKENKFTYYPLQSGSRRSVSDIVANPLLPNILIISSNGFGLYAFNVLTRQFDNQLTSSLASHNFTHVIRMYCDNHKCLWVLSQKGFAIIDMTNNKKVEVKMDDALRNLCDETIFGDVIEDPYNHVTYLASTEIGLFEFDHDSHELRRSANPQLRKLSINRLLIAPDGQLVLGTEDNGFFLYDRRTDKLVQQVLKNSQLDVSRGKVHSMAFDDEGNLWLALYNQGLLIVPKPNKNIQYSVVNEDPMGSNLGCVTSFLAFPDGSTVISVDGAGVLLRDSEGKVARYSIENSALTSNAILDLERSGNDSFYIATYSGGLFAYANGKIYRPKGLDEQDRLRVMALSYDARNRRLYMGTNGEGVYVYDEETCHCEQITSSYNKWIEDVELDAENQRLWVASAVDVFSIDLCTYAVAPIEFHKPDAPRMHDLYKTKTALWIACSEGLYYYSMLDNALHKIDIESAMGEKNVMAVMNDANGDIWFTTNNTIGCYRLQDRTIENYNSSAISMIGGFNVRSIANDISGLIVLGGDNGFVRINSETIKTRNKALKAIHFSHLWVSDNQVEYKPGADDNYLDASLWSATRLTLPAEKNSFAISFAAMEYADPLIVNYSYHLEGLESTWHQLHGGGHNAIYSNLPPGKYEFQVRASINNTNAQSSSAHLQIVVLPPWYRTWWAYLIYLLVIALIVAAVYRHWRDIALEKKRVLRAQHQEQMKEAKLQLFTSISHDIKTPLTLIISPLKKLMEKKVDNATRSTYDLMYRNAMRIMLLVNQQMDIRKIDNGQLHLKMQEMSIYAYVTEVMSYFQNIASLHEIDYRLEFQCDQDQRLWFDPNHFDKVLFNLISNAFKFTLKHGEVVVTVNLVDNPDKPEQLQISVFNSGSSISDADMAHVFERFYQGENTSASAGTGIGLNLAQQIVALHHGSLTVRNVPDRGVVFDIFLPLGKQHLAPSEIAPVATSVEKSVDPESTIGQLSPDRREIKEQDVRNIEVIGDAKPEATSKSASMPTQESETVEQKPEEGESQKQVTVLLVDDDAEFLDYVKGELHDYNVVLASDGEKAWTQLLTYAPDVVVTDLKMPGSDGFQLCQRIKSNPETDNIPVIVLTAEKGEEFAVQAVKCQADRFISKPVNIQLLQGAIAQSVKVRANILNRIRRADMCYDFQGMKMDSADEKLLQRVMDFVRENISDSNLSVVELSKEIGISRVHLNRKLKDLIGSSPSMLIKSIRLKQSAFLLLNSDVNISEIAYSVGFSSPSYFTSSFSAYFGMSPKDFIAHYQNNPNDEKLRKLLE